VTDICDPIVASDGEECPGLLAEIRSLGTLGQMWTLTVVVLCVARAVVVWPMLDEHGINPWWFLLLDVGTAPAYGLGQAMGVKILRDDTRPVKAAMPWIGMVLFSFLAPYAYVLRSAGSLPAYVVWGVVLWIAIFGALTVRRMARDVRMQPVVEPIAG
jgi:hypothetical protein